VVGILIYVEVSTMPNNDRIFFSYRRADNLDFVERIHEKFAEHYGDTNVFFDTQSISPASDWEKTIKLEVENCDVLIAIIGPEWLSIMKEKAADFAPDYVRLEISNALELKKIVFPVLIKDANLPAELPKELHDLLQRQSTRVRSGRDFRADIEHVIKSLDKAIEDNKPVQNHELGNDVSPFFTDEESGFTDRD
jgi:hypothetical protein